MAGRADHRSHELFVLFMAFRASHPEPRIRRVASWMIWKDGRLDDLLRDGLAEKDALRAVASAVKLCRDAGIDVCTFAIWKDAERIAAHLSGAELKIWLTLGSGRPHGAVQPSISAQATRPRRAPSDRRACAARPA